jgi:hypothetical protein
MPRSDAEWAFISSSLEALVREMEAQWASAPVDLAALHRSLNIGGREYPVIDLVFRRRKRATWDAYFACLDAVYREAVDSLTQLCCQEEQTAAGGDPWSSPSD